MKKFWTNLKICWSVLFGDAERYVLISIDNYSYMNLRKQVEKGVAVPVETKLHIVDLPTVVAGVMLAISMEQVDKNLGVKTRDHLNISDDEEK